MLKKPEKVYKNLKIQLSTWQVNELYQIYLHKKNHKVMQVLNGIIPLKDKLKEWVTVEFAESIIPRTNDAKEGAEADPIWHLSRGIEPYNWGVWFDIKYIVIRNKYKRIKFCKLSPEAIKAFQLIISNSKERR